MPIKLSKEKEKKQELLDNGWYRAAVGWWHPIMGDYPTEDIALSLIKAYFVHINKLTVEKLGYVYVFDFEPIPKGNRTKIMIREF